MSSDVTTQQPDTSASAYEQRVKQAEQQLADIEAQIERAVKTIIASIPPDDLPQFIGQLPYIVAQLPTLRYPNLEAAGGLLDSLSRDLDALGRNQDPAEEQKLGQRLDKNLSQIVEKLTTPSVKRAIRQAIYPILVQAEPNSLEAVILSVALMTLDTMEPKDNPMLKQMVLQTLQDTTMQLAQLQEMMANIPPASEVKPNTRLLLRLGEGMARQLGRTAYLVNFLNLNSVLLPPKELENDAQRVFEMGEKIRREGREQANDEERQEQQRMMETTLNLRYSEPRIARVIADLQGLAVYAQQSDPQRFRDMAELASFAAGSFNMVPPGEHPVLQSLYAVGVNSLVNEMMMLAQAEEGDAEAEADVQADNELASSEAEAAATSSAAAEAAAAQSAPSAASGLFVTGRGNEGGGKLFIPGRDSEEQGK